MGRMAWGGHESPAPWGPQADTTAVAGKLVSLERQARRRDLNLAVRLDAVPHTVPGTYAGPISWQSWRSSTRRVGVPCRGRVRAAVPLRGLPATGHDLQLLRPWPDLLCRGLRSARPAPHGPVRRPALSAWSCGATPPCRATRPLPGARQKSDASGFTPTATR